MEEEDIVFEEMRPRKRPGMDMKWDAPKEEASRPGFCVCRHEIAGGASE